MAKYLNRGNSKFNTNLYQACDNNTATTTLYVNSVPTNLPCVLIIDQGTSTQEKVQVTAAGTNSITVVRNYDGAGIYDHAVNASVVDYVSPQVIDDIATIIEDNFNSDGTPINTRLLTPDLAAAMANFVQSGLTVPTSASLSTTIAAGKVFYNGIEYSVATDGGHTYTASEDTYVDVNPATGVFTYNGVANGAAAPALTASSIRIAKLVSSGTAITTSTQDGSLDSLGNVIYPSKPAATLNGIETLRNKRLPRRFVPVTQSATPAIDSDTTDVASITGLAQAITSMTSGLTGTPQSGDFLEVQITDNGTARAITWGASFESTTVTLPTTTVVSTLLRVLFEWNATAAKWDCVAVV